MGAYCCIVFCEKIFEALCFLVDALSGFLRYIFEGYALFASYRN